jgi:DNA-directed RNA polymerase subunit L
MEIEILNDNKNEVELKMDNVTVAELLRVYLNEQGIEFAAWRREHPTKPIMFRIKSSGKTVKKAVGDAISTVKKDLDDVEKSMKK